MLDVNVHSSFIQGSIDMEDAVKVESSQEWPNSDRSKHTWVFTIETKSGRVYYLSAPSKEAMMGWVEKLTSTFKYYLMNNSEGETSRNDAY